MKEMTKITGGYLVMIGGFALVLASLFLIFPQKPNQTSSITVPVIEVELPELSEVFRELHKDLKQQLELEHPTISEEDLKTKFNK